MEPGTENQELVNGLARELLDAHSRGTVVPVLPSTRGGGLDLATAYDVEAQVRRLRRESGRTTVGRKVGFANKALWRVLKLKTLVWASMYDDTVRYAQGGGASLSISPRCSPRIEPEVVFKLKDAPASNDLAGVLAAAEWVAIGFEVVDCVFEDWKFQPVDFVASLGLHAALIVGEPRAIRPGDLETITEQLGAMKVRLSRDGVLVEEGAGKNSLRSPALCLAELAAAIAAQPGAEPLKAGELVSTGSLTDAHPIKAGEQWTVEPDGIDLPPLTLNVHN